MKWSFAALGTIFTVLFMFSCRKGPLVDGVNCSANCYILTGKLIDSARNAGIANGRIKFLVSQGNGQKYLGETYTDDNGNYMFKFDGTRFWGARYTVEASKDNMFYDAGAPTNVVGTFDLDNQQYNVPFARDFYLFHPAPLTVKVVADLTGYAYMNISFGFGTVPRGLSIYGNRSIDTTFTWKTAGGLPTFIKWQAFNYTTSPEIKDTVFVPLSGPAYVEIKF